MSMGLDEEQEWERKMATENERDILFGEVGDILRMTQELTRDIDAGKEPDGDYPLSYKEDRGAWMTLKRARARLTHIEVRLKTLTKQLAEPPTP